MGLAIGSFAGPNSAPATVNMIYLPMAFCAGLWIPFEFLPGALKQVAPFLPAYHLSQIALSIMHAPVARIADATRSRRWSRLPLIFGGDRVARQFARA